MEVRKVLRFNTALGFSIPKHFAQALDLNQGDHVEIYLSKKKTILLRKQEVVQHKIREVDTQIPGQLSI